MEIKEMIYMVRNSEYMNENMILNLCVGLYGML